ncbi:hypothetical protein [Thermogemmatispora tikiterensis]|uniref:Uncharacterized protein n=1 Tax=Thermogemmatispora tikiterensis TaxID=1825093 RepID=A0A328V958_9CHLR|nr:hypothetical protein [Thermogemmatispora tikiterensis]RAQ94078.1 hypothetical protein A4R35_00940 [Thermogemmatispora tikiterensis]
MVQLNQAPFAVMTAQPRVPLTDFSKGMVEDSPSAAFVGAFEEQRRDFCLDGPGGDQHVTVLLMDIWKASTAFFWPLLEQSGNLIKHMSR